MDKVFSTPQEAVKEVRDGSVVIVGGFGGSGVPYNLIEALLDQGAKDLTVISNDPMEWFPFAEKGRARKVISGFTNHPVRAEITEQVEKLVRAGKLEAEAVPHGTLEERIRAGGMGIAAFYTLTGVGTPVEVGKEKRAFNGKEYLLETALKGDVALVKGFQADRFGNVVCRLAAGNRNIVMACAATLTIAEVEEIAPPGSIDPNRVDIPGIFVNRVVQASKVVRWLVRGEM
ncbi:MAG: CoA transferase subunit A [Dehalococcoidia bacterium]|nr:CoA transferase subunit A [Dehalococcoidia bacterium]MDP7240386.1 CoA transferase subunit A [Dehalococcoidia bacterium]